MMKLITTEERSYLSSDSISPCELTVGINETLYSPDFLNNLQLSGLPNHNLTLKKGVPVMLLRNIDQQAGLCNGTRLLIRRMGLHVVEAEIITGTNVGDITFIPRMRLNSSDKRMPLQFYRRQFPLAVCFAMTINKSQGQSLSQVGLFLERPVFSHGQLYVALSRVRSKNGLRVVICDKEASAKQTECAPGIVVQFPWKGNTTDSTMEKHTPKTSALDVKTSADCDTKNELPDPLDVDTSNLKLSEFDIEVMQREIDEELKAERLKNLMAWKWDAVVDLSEDVLIVIDDESDVEAADYKESFVIKETQGDTIDDNNHPAKRARMAIIYLLEKEKLIPACRKENRKMKQQFVSLSSLAFNMYSLLSSIFKSMFFICALLQIRLKSFHIS
ncbi:ATP-dependent DNA helicase PIF1-like protein [Tanacetum coccineum]